VNFQRAKPGEKNSILARRSWPSPSPDNLPLFARKVKQKTGWPWLVALIISTPKEADNSPQSFLNQKSFAPLPKFLIDNLPKLCYFLKPADL